MNKLLKPHTIIPTELYIERDADRQLAQVINDMGRPAYILVARQMGKTNLLINAKRKSAETGDIFVYVDLSNRFDDAKSCLRNIIDIIIETNEDVLGAIPEAIYTARKVKDLPPHKEHTQELRRIISAIPGKLIICLDEIDSLTLADYSDKIFAHIRSIYFERINFPEFERLSYVLSGVAEPSEIIKDRSISPFNIGQKIFLNDFNFEEFNLFIKNANLDLDKLTIERIFYWTNGNPRLTWDICSEIEDKQISGTVIDSAEIDKTIKYKYLANFDTPPVDHIRSLISSNKSLREGLKLIYENNINGISDVIKSKLYLAGILSSGYECGKIEIKNKIIQESLSDKWLSSLQEKESISLGKALDLMRKANYKEAARLLEILMQDPDTSQEDIKIISVNLGTSYLYLGMLEESINITKNNLLDKASFKTAYIEQVYMLATASLHLGKSDEAEQYYKEVIEDKSNYYSESLLNLALLYLNGDLNYYHDEIKSMLVQVIENEVKSESYSELIPTAYLLLGRLALGKQDNKLASENFILSFESAQGTHKLAPLVSSYTLEPSEEVLTQIINIVKSDSFTLSSEFITSVLNFDPQDFIKLVSLALKESEDLLNYLIEFAISNKSNNGANHSSLLLRVATLELSNNNFTQAVSFLEKLRALGNTNFDPNDYFNIIKYLAFFSDESKEKIVNYKHEYFQGAMNYITRLDILDINIFEKEISNFIYREEFDKALTLSNIILSFAINPTLEQQIELLRIYFFRIHCLKTKEEVINEGTKFIDLIQLISQDDLKTLHIKYDEVEQLSDRIKAYIVDANTTGKVHTFVRESKKIGRNERVRVRYKNGNEVVDKYKKLESDLLNGDCSLVET